MSPRIILAAALAAFTLGRMDAHPPVAAKLQPFVDGHFIAGAVTLCGDRDRVLSVETIGYSDLAARKPMPPDALFWIASMSKSVTGAALMMLVDEGKVKVDDPVEKYLPEFKGQMVLVDRDQDHAVLRRPSHPLTIRTLLTHTGGLTPIPLWRSESIFSLRENVLVYPLLPPAF